MLIIDRFEGKFAIIEYGIGDFREILAETLPENAKEGDVIFEKNGSFFVDREATSRLRAEVIEQQNKLWE